MEQIGCQLRESGSGWSFGEIDDRASSLTALTHTRINGHSPQKWHFILLCQCLATACFEDLRHLLFRQQRAPRMLGTIVIFTRRSAVRCSRGRRIHSCFPQCPALEGPSSCRN